VIQPQIPLRLPCYDFSRLTEPGFERIKGPDLIWILLGWSDGQCVQGAGTYSSLYNEQRLLGIPASRG